MVPWGYESLFWVANRNAWNGVGRVSRDGRGGGEVGGNKEGGFGVHPLSVRPVVQTSSVKLWPFVVPVETYRREGQHDYHQERQKRD